MLTPVDNPSAYGLVETAADGSVRRFLEKPSADEITCDTINAGIYVLEPDTFDRIPKDMPYSIERAYFPSLVERGETVRRLRRARLLDRHRHAGEVHRRAPRHLRRPLSRSVRPASPPARPLVAADARVEAGAVLEGPCFVDAGAVVKAGAHIGPYSVIGRGVVVEEDARVVGRIVWPNTRIGRDAVVDGAILGRSCHVGRNARVGPTADARRQDGAHGFHAGLTASRRWRTEPLAMINPDIFKAYDVRGLYPQEVSEEVFQQLGRAFVAFLGPGRVAVTRDMRLSSPSLAAAFIDGATAAGRAGHRLRPGRHRHDVLRGGQRRPRRRRADHRVAQPEAVQRLQAGAAPRPSRSAASRASAR